MDHCEAPECQKVEDKTQLTPAATLGTRRILEGEEVRHWTVAVVAVATYGDSTFN